ncbi:hypothetical protein ACFQYP_02675 [Nonomuraea antimicrobica]
MLIAQVLGGQGGDRAGVEAAGQQRAQGTSLMSWRVTMSSSRPRTVLTVDSTSSWCSCDSSCQ